MSVSSQLARVLRNFPYPIKKGVLKLTPKATSTEASIPLCILCEPRKFYESLWCGYSWALLGDVPLKMTFLVDGEVSDRQRADANRLFPNATVHEAREFVSDFRDVSTECREFFDVDTFGRKIALMYTMTKTAPMLFCDFDILFFQRPTEILDCLNATPETQPFSCLEDQFWHYDRLIEANASQAGIELVRQFNSGLMLLPQGCLPADLVANLLTGWTYRGPRQMTEQTFFSAVFGSFANQGLEWLVLPKDRYLIEFKGDFFDERNRDYSKIVMRHYNGMVRQHLYLKGLPYLRKLARV